jgi:hypothetical protein
VERMSKSLTVWWPAAARKRLSGEMHSRLTCESGCWIVREQMPERASQNLKQGVSSHSQGSRVHDLRSAAGRVPDGMVVTSCALRVSILRRCISIAKGAGDSPVQSMTDIVERLYAHHGAVRKVSGVFALALQKGSWSSRKSKSRPRQDRTAVERPHCGGTTKAPALPVWGLANS